MPKVRNCRPLTILLAASLALASGAGAKTTLTIESWRNDDLQIWKEKIIPAFNKQYPDIQVVFSPTAPTEYNAALSAKLRGGTAGDIITCRPFDLSLDLFKGGYLASLNDLKGMSNFSKFARSAWSTDDGKTTFCVPMASVIHGFLYNKTLFDQLGLKVPKTDAQFFATLAAIKAKSKAAPLVMGTKDQWESATMGYQNIGPAYWGGEQGRKGLIAGTAKYNSGGFLTAFQTLAKWGPYLERGYKAVSYPDAQNLFSLGRGVIYPAGSWDISVFRAKNAGFELAAFAPPAPAGKKCVIDDHPDIGMGLNKASKNQAAARTFLAWAASPQFAEIYANALPGFFPLSSASVKIEDPVARQFVSWRKTCDTTFRSSYQILSRGTPNNENDLWNASAQVINATLTPRAAADMVQKNLDSWYKPGR